jgi:hypothetical protein
MLNEEEIKFKLVKLGDATRAKVLYDMDFNISHYDFFSLKFQQEVNLENFLKRYSQ